MGVLLSDVVMALFPEHAAPGHIVTVAARPTTGRWDEPTHWSCTCGHADVLLQDDVARALREDLVART